MRSIFSRRGKISECLPGMLNQDIDHRPVETTYADPFFAGAEVRTELIEKMDRYIIQIDAGGVGVEQLEAAVEGGVLTLSVTLDVAPENPISDTQTSQVLRKEFRLDNIDEDAITADYKEGVLTVALPKIGTSHEHKLS